MVDPKKILSIKNLKKYYPIKKSSPFEKASFLKAVDGVEFDIFEGETFGLVGESGCGKSTTGYMILGLISATEGSIEFKGRDITKASRKEQIELRKQIQIVFQDPYGSLNPKKKIGWLMEEPLIIHKAGNRAHRKMLVDEMLKLVGLDPSYKDVYPHQLSGGQRQRVSIALALILKPDFVVADEAVSALDVSIQAQILNLMRKLQNEMRFTYLFISHDLNVVKYMSDRVGVMYLGKIVETGLVKDIYENPLHPYTKALLSAIPDISGEKKERIILNGEISASGIPQSGCPFCTRCFNAKSICFEKMPELKGIFEERKIRCHFINQI